jgi:uncharacterized membrane protein (UPF0127 family)
VSFARARRSALALVAWLGACEGAPELCDEDPRAQVLDERVEIEIGALLISAELAATATARERGWKHRRCDREALLLVPDAPGTALPVWGCALVEPLDAHFIADQQVRAIERIEPCPEPCEGCPRVGEELLVDAVLEVPADALVTEIGASAIIREQD